jgi:hypothetical protein
MPLPLTILGSKYGTATTKTSNGFKINLPFFVTASVLIFLSACCLSPINGVEAADGRVESNDVADLQNVGHQQRQKRAAVTPLGKRLTTKLVAELGTRPRHLYSFGIGQ